MISCLKPLNSSNSLWRKQIAKWRPTDKNPVEEQREQITAAKDFSTVIPLIVTLCPHWGWGILKSPNAKWKQQGKPEVPYYTWHEGTDFPSILPRQNPCSHSNPSIPIGYSSWRTVCSSCKPHYMLRQFTLTGRLLSSPSLNVNVAATPTT